MLDFNHGSKRAADDPRAPALTERLNTLVNAALQQRAALEPPRDYLGASSVGGPCKRQTQFQYTDTPVDPGEEFSGRTLRIFEVGHVFEDMAADWLRAAGFTVLTHEAPGRQFRFVENVGSGKFSGGIDGKIVAGPDWLKYPCLWENKSKNEKGWQGLVKHGVTIAEPVYADQIALYQAYMGLHENPALFTAINKNTEEIYAELVPFDADRAQRASDRAVEIILATERGELLPRAFANADHYRCKWCSYSKRCWSL